MSARTVLIAVLSQWFISGLRLVALVSVLVSSGCAACPCGTHGAATATVTTPVRREPAPPGQADSASGPLHDAPPQQAHSSSDPPTHGDPPGTRPCCGLSPEQIQAVFMASAPQFQDCYASQGAGRSGRVILSFTVSPGGSVETASVEDDKINAAALSDCLLSVVRAMSFPAADLKTHATFPFSFRPTKT